MDDPTERILCAECKTPFRPPRAWSKYCSKRCGGRQRSRRWTQVHVEQARENSARQNAKRLPFSQTTVAGILRVIEETPPEQHAELAHFILSNMRGYAYLSRPVESFIADTLGDDG